MLLLVVDHSSFIYGVAVVYVFSVSASFSGKTRDSGNSGKTGELDLYPLGS